MPSLSSARADFLLACEADGLSPASLRWYASILGRFASAFPPDTALKDISANDIRHWLVGLKATYSLDTVGSYTRALHKFWKWSTAEYGILNPMRNIRYPRPPERKDRAADMVDILNMYEVAGVRDRAIICLILDTGIRAGGLCGLRMKSIDLERLTVTVFEKGKKTRTVPFKPFTAAHLEAWIAERRAEAEYLFHHLDGNERLQPNGLYQAMKRLGEQVGAKRFNPHSFRHMFSNAYYEKGQGRYMVELARMMGHRDMRTLIENYISRTDEHVRAAHDQFSPIDTFAALLEAKTPNEGASDPSSG